MGTTVKETNVNEHRGADGHVNWVAYRAAQRDNGERCARCGAFTGEATGRLNECDDCQRIRFDQTNTHDHALVCPYCCHVFDPADGDPNVFESGEREVDCLGCGKAIRVETRITHTWSCSPITPIGGSAS